MRIQRTAQVGESTIIPNATARDHGISFTARGILAYVLSLPNGSQATVTTLTAASSEGRERVSRALTELETAGYLKRLRVRGEGGRITTSVTWSDLREGAEGVANAQVAPDAGNPAAGPSAHNPLGGKDQTLPPTPQTAVTVESAPEGREGGEISRSEKLLAGLVQAERKLHLGAGDIRTLSPLVDEWFALGADERLIVTTLTAGLPEQVSRPAGLIRRRLVEKLPTRSLAAPAMTLQPSKHECPECQRPTRSAGPCGPCAGRIPAPAAPTHSPINWRELAKDFGPGALIAA
jgi:DNA-binding MarR family transcriptional regulator